MKVDYSILSLALGLVYAILIKFAPDFPISPEVVGALVLYALTKLGVAVVGAPVRSFLARKFG
jgi:hypothetical protein